MAACMATGEPGTSSGRHRLASVATSSTASVHANCSPMHRRLPKPNGIHAPRGWPGAASS
jgi:hypothetical protein